MPPGTGRRPRPAARVSVPGTIAEQLADGHHRHASRCRRGRAPARRPARGAGSPWRPTARTRRRTTCAGSRAARAASARGTWRPGRPPAQAWAKLRATGRGSGGLSPTVLTARTAPVPTAETASASMTSTSSRRPRRRFLRPAGITRAFCLRLGALRRGSAGRGRAAGRSSGRGRAISSPSRRRRAGRPSGQVDAQPVELPPLAAAQPARRQQALEHVAEPHEHRALDQADHLAGERLVPAAVEQHVLQQERQADVVAAPLDQRRLPLAVRARLGQPRELVLVGRCRRPLAQVGDQRPVADQVGIAADRAREVAVRGERQPGVSEVLRVVAGALQRPQDERRERRPAPPRRARRTGPPTRRSPPRRRRPGPACAARAAAASAPPARPAARPATRRRPDRATGGRGRAPAPARRTAARRPAGWRAASAPRPAGGPRSPPPACAAATRPSPQLELHLARLDVRRAVGEPLRPQPLGDCGRVAQRPLDVLGDVLLAGQDPLRLRIAEPGPAADQAAVRASSRRPARSRRSPPRGRRPAAGCTGRRTAARGASARPCPAGRPSIRAAPPRRRAPSRPAPAPTHRRCGRTAGARRPRARRRSRRRSPAHRADRP